MYGKTRKCLRVGLLRLGGERCTRFSARALGSKSAGDEGDEDENAVG